MSTRGALLILGACASTPAVTRKPPVDPCHLGDKPAPITPLVIAGYPVPTSHPTQAQLDARRDELEKRVPGWQLELDRDGFITKAVSVPVGKYQNAIGSELVERVATMVHALHDVLGVAADVTPIVQSRYISIRDGKPDPVISVQQGNAAYSARRDLPQKLRDQMHDDVVLELTVTHPRTTPLPNMPAGAQELTDVALRELWHIADTAELRVTVAYPNMPCDPVGPNDCHQTEKEPDVTCIPAVGLSYERGAVERDGLLRHVIAVRPPDHNGQRPWADAAFPLCYDAFTGEDLRADLWCQRT